MIQNEPGSRRFIFSKLTPHPEVVETIELPVTIEAPVAVEYNGIGYAVMMATPIDLTDFAIGFSLSEQVIDSADQISSIAAHEAELGWILRIQVAQENTAKIINRARRRTSESSCGLCGMDNLEDVMRALPMVTAQVDVPAAAIFSALSTLRTHQSLNAATGSAHAAAFCAPDGTIILTREDVGRHNALDKLIGALAMAGTPASSGFILLTARCSLELAQKAIIANCPLLVTISAATDLAINMAAKHGLRLVSLARPDGALAAARQVD
jgi:FdhD protein